MRRGQRKRAGAGGSLRIIAGEYRGRRIPVSDRPELRPTGDRVRETLFNWLAPVMPGSRCLDLFAGTGALALEAASRGAKRVLAVERDRGLAAAIGELAREWGAGCVESVHADALSLLSGPPEPFDVIFLDPPFEGRLLAPALERLGSGWLAPGALVYVETPAGGETAVPEGWSLERERRAGQVALRLYRAGD